MFVACYCTSMSDEAPIMLRARITGAEYAALRKVAIDRNESVADTIAAALRKSYPTITERQAK